MKRLGILWGVVATIGLSFAPSAAADPSAASLDPRAPAVAVENMDLASGLDATLFAAEPMIVSLTNLDVDHRGRVWVCEVQNYRGHRGKRPAGDRILILEDTSGDGKADRSIEYYQGADINSAMGICVLGNQVIVSASPNVFLFTDEDGDDRPDRKDVLFTKTGELQHDHSAHSFVFGPDGKLYWNFGNTGKHVHDKHGEPVVDLAGNVVVDNGKPFHGGMVFRCDLDGNHFEVLGHNFRNNYEVAVDSFGTLWQSDNDDDGNRAVRINYVMEFGNFGYLDEFTGAGWKEPYTGMHADIPMRHWHQNDPGVVPNLLVTGAGSPCGIAVYEGRLLPERYWDQMIHCDAGPNVVRAYPVTKHGAGYAARTVDLLRGARDDWFRPVDVCVAPDGSLFVTDWYDPGVGGHQQQDLDRGRLLRVAPKGHPYMVSTYDFSSAEGSIEALKNPCQAVRYLAWKALRQQGAAVEPALRALFSDAQQNVRHRARALWLLGRLEKRGSHYVQLAIADKEPDLRVVALRLAGQLQWDVLPYVRRIVSDESAQVRRQGALALRCDARHDAALVWAELATAHDGNDRWYLEALGIGASGKWDACMDAWLAKVGDQWNSPAGLDLVWRSRASVTADYLARIIGDPATPTDALARYFRAFDFLSQESKQGELAGLALAEAAGDAQRQKLILSETFLRLDPLDIQQQPQYATALGCVLDMLPGTDQFIRLVDIWSVADRYGALLDLARKHADEALGVAAIRVLLAKGENPTLEAALGHEDIDVALATARVLGNAADDRAAPLLAALVQDEQRPFALHAQAARSLTKTRAGALVLIELAEANRLSEPLRSAAAFAMHLGPWEDIRKRAASHFPLPAAKNDQPLPMLAELLALPGNVEQGRGVFDNGGTCIKCHVVAGRGIEIGPELTEIGDKLSREALFESILDPSAGISHNYESYAAALAGGTIVTGILVSRTDDAITLKSAENIQHAIPAPEVELLQKQSSSLMPADLAKTMTAQELADVVAYLRTLKKESP